MEVLDAKTAYNFLRMRRSIRIYTGAGSAKKDEMLLISPGMVPTAANSQGLYYIVVSDRELIKKITDCVADWMQEEIDNNSPRRRYFRKVLEVYRSGRDIIGRNANSWCSFWPAG